MKGLLYIAILLIATGCSLSQRQPRALDEAGNLMLEDPAAALSKLNGIDVSEFNDSATMARWALLYSEAMVVNRLTAPTDTIVNIAIDYYGRHNLDDEFRKASRLKALMRESGTSDALATALYLQKEKEFMLYKERVKKESVIYVSVVALIIAAGIIIWMRQRVRLESARNDVLMAEASGLKCRIEESSGKLYGLLENRFALIDSLCQTYYESQGTKSEKKAVADKVRDEIDKVRTDSFSEMEQAVNDCRDGILSEVKDAYHDMKDDDYRLLVYFLCGLSSRTVSLLLGESVDVVYKRKSRLKMRLKERVAPSCPRIMEVF